MCGLASRGLTLPVSVSVMCVCGVVTGAVACWRSQSMLSAASVGLAGLRLRNKARAKRKKHAMAPPLPPPVARQVSSRSSEGLTTSATGSLAAILALGAPSDEESGAPERVSSPLIQHGVQKAFETTGGTRMNSRRRESRMLFNSKSRAQYVACHPDEWTCAALTHRATDLPNEEIPGPRCRQCHKHLQLVHPQSQHPGEVAW